MAGKLDLIIDTSPANNDISANMDMLKFDGIYVRVGIPPADDQGQPPTVCPRAKGSNSSV